MTRLEKRLSIVCVILIILLISTYFYLYNSDSLLHFKYVETIMNASLSIVSGILSSVLILYFSRTDLHLANKSRFEQLEGNYKRTFIVQYDTNDQHQFELKEQNIGLQIELRYIENNIFNFTAQYWRNENEATAGTIRFNEYSEYIGEGTYKYTNKTIDDIGTYKIQRFIDSPAKIYVYYENTIPKNGARGFEIWEKN